MNKTTVKKAKKNKANEKVYKILSHIDDGIGGIVAYFFVSEKYNKETDEMEEEKSTLHTKLSPHIFTKEIHGKEYRRSYAEVVQILQDTCNDIGATYYRID